MEEINFFKKEIKRSLLIAIFLLCLIIILYYLNNSTNFLNNIKF